MRIEKTLVNAMLVCCSVIVLLTGAFLAFFYTPSGRVVYDGPYGPLPGIEMSGAYASALQLSFEVRGGLFIRQLHQWSSLIFLMGIVLRTILSRAFLQALPGIALLGLGALNEIWLHGPSR
ncbi:DUF4405 domain-containing protein [Streptosporangium roseum]|uniref:Cytochrome bc1 complex cytochrome b subunit n=1 Tax=Streptosporangium roseum (strain ATCC 12428 / DSM 43021 / JCM 3005 / KCTC 9067 / NCIMB 10171 / NRRL 2505 / NI 9100) TaxID=479432 RepID=D2B8L3_STRRD|nr:DUF4405 domain-containing protein [Streptosporangium roseum]ACZ87823.1 cytochrome b/b6 domain protein [Streptosporangium roseum DSM 43021]